MILHSLTTKGFGLPFANEEVVVDYDSLPGDGAIVAFVGPNGAGKSHLLELSGPATLHRQFVSYGEPVLAHAVPGVQAYAELDFSVRDERYRARVQCDPDKGKTEAYLIQGERPIAGLLVSDYAAAIAKLIPPYELYIASVFAAPAGIGSFFSLSKKDRKDLFTEMLGVAHYQELAEIASRRAQERLRALESIRSTLAAKVVQAERRTALSVSIAELEWKLETLKPEVERLRADVCLRREEASIAFAALAAAEASGRARDQEAVRLAAATSRVALALSATSDGILNARRVLVDRPNVLQAEKDLARLDRQLQVIRADEEEVRAELQPLEIANGGIGQEIQSLRGEYSRAQADLTAAEQYATTAQQRERLVGEIQCASGRAAGLREEYLEAEGGVATIEKTVEEIRSKAQRATLLRSRIEDREQRKSGFQKINLKHPMCGACPLTEDGRRAVDEIDAMLAELMGLPPEAELEDALRVLDGSKKRCVEALGAWVKGKDAEAVLQERLAALPAPPAGGVSIDDLRAALDATKTLGQEKRAAFSANTKHIDELKARAAQIADARAELEQVRPAAAALAARAAEMQIAAASEQELEQRIARLEEEAKGLEAEVAALPPPVDVSDLKARNSAARAAQDTVERELETQVSAVAAVERDIARLDGERQSLGDPDAEVTRLRGEEQRVATEVSDWSVLEVGLGRDGVQALEIDAAGPGVTAIANDLLSSCYGPRFSLAIETTAPMKKKGMLKEVFDVRIIDADAGGLPHQPSQGEGAILDEVMRLSLAIYNTQRSGRHTGTLYRDEKVGPLDPDNANRYMAMLRRAAKIGGFDRILMIAQQPAVWAQADARIFVQPGGVRVEA